jgi:glycosyltransferase involved in cell wall biosynthesis
MYCDPDDAADIASKIRLVLSSDMLREELRQGGLERAREFSWGRSALQLEELLAATPSRVAA